MTDTITPEDLLAAGLVAIPTSYVTEARVREIVREELKYAAELNVREQMRRAIKLREDALKSLARGERDD